MNTLNNTLAASMILLAGLAVPAQAQEYPYSKPSWFFGVAAGANANQYRGTTQILNDDLTVPGAFFHGDGIGLFIAPLIEYHRPDSRWGFILQAGYDSRKGSWDQVLTPCDCPADLSTELSYLTIEPSIRFAPFKGNFHLYGGPRFAFNLNKSFTYELGINPAFPDQEPTPDVNGDFGDMNSPLVSMQIAAGYDMPMTSQHRRTQWVVTPFLAYMPQWGQTPRSVNTWEISTIRLGAALKFGRGTRNPAPAAAIVPAPVIAAPIKTSFFVTSPRNVPTQRRVRETFPIRNYVFFDLESTQIPDRYALLQKSETSDFNENRLDVLTPKRLTGRADRELNAYYNVLNILGNRMNRFPSANVTLVGSSEKGEADAKLMAESVKSYLTSVWSVNPSRITVEGQRRPEMRSEQPGARLELELLRQEDRRVTIESTSKDMLMVFQTGPQVPLRPIALTGVQEAPIDSYLIIDVNNASRAYSSWSLEFKDSAGKLIKTGPYTENRVAIPGKTILGATASGDYQITMVGQTRSGLVERKDTTLNMVLWTPPTDEEGQRFSILYGFDNSEATRLYDDYLTDEVMPKIPNGATVVIHGHTDIIGDAANNQRLSLARADDVKRILQAALKQAGRSDVTINTLGFGENEEFSLFANTYPEERFYNRSVIIDIIPRK
jgi:outer membrane protein OmpA-like peptidoglycan-associated protein